MCSMSTSSCAASEINVSLSRDLTLKVLYISAIVIACLFPILTITWVSFICGNIGTWLFFFLSLFFSLPVILMSILRHLSHMLQLYIYLLINLNIYMRIPDIQFV